MIKLEADPHTLLDKIGEKMTQKHLNKLLSSHIIYKVKINKQYSPEKELIAKEEKTEYLMYFFNCVGRVKWMELNLFLYQ